VVNRNDSTIDLFDVYWKWKISVVPKLKTSFDSL